ncbi:MAG TPA: ABC transporter permease, partial [Acidobacteriaceae bacterium]|nr:ABC transporter permease [Acidobacteriaceae bacterium]
GPMYIAKSGGHDKRIVVVASDPGLAGPIVRELTTPGDGPSYMAKAALPAPGLKESLTQQVQEKSLSGFLWIDHVEGKFHASYFSNSSDDLELASALESAVQHAQATEQLVARGIPAEQVQSMFDAKVDMRKIAGGKAAGGIGTFASSVMLMMMLYISIIVQGVAVGNSVVEEKTSRIFEIMLATVTPEEMMSGKLLGVGAVGLTQVLVWMTCGMLLAAPGLLGAHRGGQFSFHLSAGQAIAFAICFVLGFLFYSALSAMLGSLVNSSQELQQLNLFITLPLAFSLVFFQQVMSDPSGTLAVVLSMLPPCAPILMYLRISVLTPPAWQLALSLVLMVAGVWTMVWLASRIYRVGVLMYGKRPTLPELMRWLRYS